MYRVVWLQAKNIGILCRPYGDDTGFVCLDINKKDRGMEIFKKLQQRYGYLECLYETMSSRGLYFVFEYNKRMDPIKSHTKMVKLGNEVIGIDFKTKGGFFVCMLFINWVTKKNTNGLLSQEWKSILRCLIGFMIC